jgi:hypothetical protein
VVNPESLKPVAASGFALGWTAIVSNLIAAPSTASDPIIANSYTVAFTVGEAIPEADAPMMSGSSHGILP